MDVGIDIPIVVAELSSGIAVDRNVLEYAPVPKWSPLSSGRQSVIGVHSGSSWSRTTRLYHKTLIKSIQPE